MRDEERDRDADVDNQDELAQALEDMDCVSSHQASGLVPLAVLWRDA
jgi:hypothetical protein